MARLASLDMYRKVPVDLLEGTRRGSFLSTLALLTMATLFFLETKAFFSTTIATSLALDSNAESKTRVNFNITMMDLRCDYATIDVVSVLGTQQNVTQHLTKYPIDGYGVKQRYRSRNLKQHDVNFQQFDSTVEATIEDLHADGEDAVSLDMDMLRIALERNTYVFVDFFASWCSHCRNLAPTWETLAEVMFEVAESKVENNLDRHDLNHDYTNSEYNAAVTVELPVLIAKVDCVDHQELCQENQIRAYPTLKFFVDGEEKGDYNGHRTVIELAHFIEEMEKEHKGSRHRDLKGEGAAQVATDRTIRTAEHVAYADSLSATRQNAKHSWDEEDHPGCQLSGFLLVDRAPGNFHIQAQSTNHDLAAHMTNVSHIINHLSFGKPFSKYFLRQGLKNTPAGFLETTRPFDGNVYVTHGEHEAHHHYLKVITTDFSAEVKKRERVIGDQTQRAYQVLQSSQLSLYRSDIVPEAKFTYDLSPIAVSYSKQSRKWYDYFTSLMAIIGGTFTVVGMLESGMYAASKKRR